MSPASTPSEASTIPGLMMSAPLLTKRIAPISTVTVLSLISLASAAFSVGNGLSSIMIM